MDVGGPWEVWFKAADGWLNQAAQWWLVSTPLEEDDVRVTLRHQTRANEHSGRVSPDGRWIAYVSDESGQAEVYVSRFPEMQGRFAVSASGVPGRSGDPMDASCTISALAAA
jgi:hypothetical protein